MGALALHRSSLPSPTTQQRARSLFGDLEGWLASEDALHRPLHEVEFEQEQKGREIMRLLLQAHVDRRGDGDVGPALAVVPRAGGRAQRHGQRRRHTRQILSIFGKISVLRLAYFASKAGSVHPLDEQAWLPNRSFGYELQRRTLVAAIQGPFDEAVERVEAWTGNRLSKRSAEDLVRDAAVDFEAFYAQRELPSPNSTGPVLVASVDCKGIPMVNPASAMRTSRRKVGAPKNKKRMATVATVFTQQRRQRTADEIVDRLFYEGPRCERPTPPKPRVRLEHKRVWASVEKEKDGMFDEIVSEIRVRDPAEAKQLVLLIDGERGLQYPLAERLPRAVEVLDFMHVLEKLWKASFCFYDERSAEARAWTKSRALRLLRGGVSSVIQGMQQAATKRGLSQTRRKAVDVAVRYFRRNQHRMRYDAFLQDGLPIASGAVEGACKNLVKDRMERSGMRWTIEGAEAMVRMRAVYLSGDFDAFWAFHVLEEQRRLHPPGRWRVVEE